MGVVCKNCSNLPGYRTSCKFGGQQGLWVHTDTESTYRKEYTFTAACKLNAADSTPLLRLHANSTPLLLLTLLQGAEHAPAAAATSANSIYKCSHKRIVVAELDLHLSHNTE